MIDVPLVAVYMLQSHHTLMPAVLSAAKQPSPQIKMLGVGFQLPFKQTTLVVVGSSIWQMIGAPQRKKKFNRQL